MMLRYFIQQNAAALGLETGDFVQVLVALLTSIISLWAAISAWKAAVASERSAREMLAARHQYVRPILTTKDADFSVVLSIWRDCEKVSPGYRLFQELNITNVGKGPAYDLKIYWYVKCYSNFIIADFNPVNANLVLSDIDCELIPERMGGYSIQKISTEDYVDYVPLGDFMTDSSVVHLPEGASFMTRTPSNYLSQFVVSALSSLGGQQNQDYGYPMYFHLPWQPKEVLDVLELSYRSITDELIRQKYAVRVSGGVWRCGASGSMPVSLKLIFDRID